MSYYKDNKKQMYSDINHTLEIFHRWAKRGLIMGQIKEKYNSSRWYAYLGTLLSLHILIYPGYYFNQFPKWLQKLDTNFFIPFFKYSGISYLFGKWQFFCYKQAYKEVLTKYPHLDHCIDHQELVEKWIPENWK